MILTANDEQEYKVCFTGDFEALNDCHIAKNDSIQGTAFMSRIGDRKFLNLKVKGVYYIAEFVYEDDKISLLPLCEHFTNKIIKSGTEITGAIFLHFKTRLYPLYDEPFCLRNMVRVN